MLQIVTVALIFCLARPIIKLLQNRRVAKRTGLPYILSPVGEEDPLWLLAQKPLAPILEKLPFALGRFARYTTRGWRYHKKARAHQELGSVFLVVSPSGIFAHVGDAAAANSILLRRKDFLKPLKHVKPELIDAFGDSVISTEGADWQRHRRITAPPFNERNNALVWNEATRQAQRRLEQWKKATTVAAPITTISNDTARMALDVLMAAGFGMTSAFRNNLDAKGDGYEMSYRDALHVCMADVLVVFLVPPMIFKLPWLPKRVANYKTAVSNFKRHLRQLVAATKNQLKSEGLQPSHNDPRGATLIKTLVARAQEPHSQDNDSLAPGSANSLSDSEIYGNLFMYSFAGHETMAMTLAYAIYLLAAYPKWQEWAGEEVEAVFEGHKSIETLEYDKLFVQLKRCRAIMYEVLRLFPPGVSIPKTTGKVDATIKVENREFTIPQNTPIYPNVLALHTNPTHWGKDSFRWNPSRWIQPSTRTTPPEGSPPKTTQPSSLEGLMDPPVAGSFIPWADGPRVCPGRKFSEVEFAAAISVLLWKHRIAVKRKPGESAAEAEARALHAVEDSIVHFTLRMRKPESVGLVFRAKA